MGVNEGDLREESAKREALLHAMRNPHAYYNDAVYVTLSAQ